MPEAERYTILEEIASGSTATVYLAEDTVLRRKVALKKLHPHLHNHVEVVKRFQKEAVAIAALSHENIIKVFEFGNQGRDLFLAMEYVDGTSLESLLHDAPGGLPNLVALSIFHQLLRGLAAAHDAGIIHRDIKPSNVLVDTKGCVRIADFGIAFLSEETSITKTGSYLGTPGYSAPEQAQGKAATRKTDIFATGVLFYRCLTGKLPFEAETPHAVLLAILEKTPVKAHMVNRHLIPGLTDLIEGMLSKDPDQRPDAGVCSRRLETLAAKDGFPLESIRIRRFAADRRGYPGLEYREISLSFAASARAARQEGRQRDAMKYFSLAEIFADAESDVGREAAGFLKQRAAQDRKRKWIGTTLSVLCLAACGTWLFRERAGWVPDSPARIRSDAQAVPKAAMNTVAGAMGAASTPAMAASVTAVKPVADPYIAGVSASTAGEIPQLPRGRKAKGKTMLAAGSGNRPPGDRHAVPGPSMLSVAPLPRPIPALGFLIVKTNPPFAKIRIDGKPAGITPTKSPLEIDVGSHKLDLERDGCSPSHSFFMIAARETTSLRYTLQREAGPEP